MRDEERGRQAPDTQLSKRGLLIEKWGMKAAALGVAGYVGAEGVKVNQESTPEGVKVAHQERRSSERDVRELVIKFTSDFGITEKEFFAMLDTLRHGSDGEMKKALIGIESCLWAGRKAYDFLKANPMADNGGDGSVSRVVDENLKRLEDFYERSRRDRMFREVY